MPSLEESLKQVEDGLSGALDHDTILAGLQHEIDKHNAIKDDLKDTIHKRKSQSKRKNQSKSKSQCKSKSRRRSPRGHDSESPSDSDMRFRFKAGTDDPRQRKRKHKDHDDNHRSKHRKTTPPQESPIETTPHPFPREPASTTDPTAPYDAFRDSLFDALADDEGAAAYWESVYSQPIHIYPRPYIPHGDDGEGLEAMSDAEYVEFVKQQMWERKNPEIVLERKKKEQERKEEEERKVRDREDFVRRKERAAWERAQRRLFREMTGGEQDEEDEFEFTGHANNTASTRAHTRRRKEEEYAGAWSTYLAAWDALKHELLSVPVPNTTASSTKDVAKQIPWPVLPSQTVTKPNIEAFMRHASPASDTTEGKMKILKAERVKWHPDKMQQRFSRRGTVDEATMKLVTGVFLVVEQVLSEERERLGQ